MSIEWMNRVLGRAEPTGTARMVLLILADRADERGICWPGVDYLASRSGVKRRAAQNALQALEREGWISRRTNAGPADRGDRRPSVYHLQNPQRGARTDTPNGVHEMTDGVHEMTDGVHEMTDGVHEMTARGARLCTQSVSDPSEIPHDPMARKRARPSDLAEVIAYGIEIGLPSEQCERLFDHYEANGWRQGGKTVLKDWRAALRNWWRRWRDEGHGPEKSSGGGGGPVLPFDPDKPNAHTGGVEAAN